MSERCCPAQYGENHWSTCIAQSTALAWAEWSHPYVPLPYFWWLHRDANETQRP